MSSYSFYLVLPIFCAMCSAFARQEDWPQVSCCHLIKQFRNMNHLRGIKSKFWNRNPLQDQASRWSIKAGPALRPLSCWYCALVLHIQSFKMVTKVVILWQTHGQVAVLPVFLPLHSDGNYVILVIWLRQQRHRFLKMLEGSFNIMPISALCFAKIMPQSKPKQSPSLHTLTHIYTQVNMSVSDGCQRGCWLHHERRAGRRSRRHHFISSRLTEWLLTGCPNPSTPLTSL